MNGVRKILSTLRKPQLLTLLLGAVMVSGGGYLLWPNQQQAATAPTPVLAEKSLAPPVDCSVDKCLALTFDDGPHPEITPQILDILKRHDAKATFFVLGRRVPGNEALLQRMHAEGHEIGNHTWNHPYLTRIPPQQVQSEIMSTQEAVAKAGVPAPRLFRPPYGDMNEALKNQIPLTVVRWDIDPADWHPRKRDHMLEHMAAHAHPGGVVVMHDTMSSTAQKLELLLTQLEGQQYTFVTASKALGITPGQRGVYYGR